MFDAQSDLKCENLAGGRRKPTVAACVQRTFVDCNRLRNDGRSQFQWQVAVQRESRPASVLQPRAAEAGEVSSDVSLANLTARQQPQGKQQQTGSVVYSQLNTNPAAACLPLPAFTLGWEIKPAHRPNTISFPLRLNHKLTSSRSGVRFAV